MSNVELPKKFRIANQEYTVELCDFVEGNTQGEFWYGYHSDAELTIKVARKMRKDNGDEIQLTEEQIRNSFWHEVFHAFQFYYDNGQDEALAQTFANFMREYEITKQ